MVTLESLLTPNFVFSATPTGDEVRLFASIVYGLITSFKGMLVKEGVIDVKTPTPPTVIVDVYDDANTLIISQSLADLSLVTVFDFIATNFAGKTVSKIVIRNQ